MKNKAYLSLVFVSLFLSGCRFIDTVMLYSQPHSNWMSIEDERFLNLGKTLHLRIYDGQIWVAGNEALQLREQIVKSFTLMIDNTTISKDRIIFLNVLQGPIDVKDNNGNILGTHYASSDIYLFDMNLHQGLHNFSVKLKGTSDHYYSFTWYFWVN